jgi:hypothetical protein
LKILEIKRSKKTTALSYSHSITARPPLTVRWWTRLSAMMERSSEFTSQARKKLFSLTVFAGKPTLIAT